MVLLWRTLILIPTLIYGGKLKHEDQTRRREKCTRSKKVVNQKLKAAVHADDTFLLDDWDNWLDDSEA